MTISNEQLKTYGEEYGFSLTDRMVEQFGTYADTLLEWNQKMNLTAITQPDDIVIKHFLDSLMLLKSVPLQEGSSMIDVGTGAGFPSVPVKIARPDVDLTLLDSLNKRVTFYRHCLKLWDRRIPPSISERRKRAANLSIGSGLILPPPGQLQIWLSWQSTVSPLSRWEACSSP